MYDAAGQDVGRIDPLLRRTTRGYDPAGRLTSKVDGRLLALTYDYDPAGQPVRERRPDGTRVTFAYDPAGRRRAMRDPDGGRTTYAHDPAGQLVGLVDPRGGRTTFGYDPAGREARKWLANGTRVTQAYDPAGQLTLVHTGGPAGPVGRRSYAYDGTGRRVGKVAGGETTRYVWDGEKVLREVDGSGATGRQYLSTDQQYGDLVSAYGGETGGRYYAFDALGSAEALLDDTGSPAEQYSYRAFGLVSSSGGGTPGAEMPLALPAPLGESGAGGSAEPYTWVGRQGYQRDAETGFYFLRARMYDPSSGRFVLPDPVGFAAGDANLYRYCGNDPVNHTDPSGHFGLEEFFSAIDSFVPSRDNIIKWLLKGAGVDADRFWASIERCDGLNIVMYFDGDRIVGLFTNPSRFAPLLRTLTEATNEAFSEVQRTLWERGKGALALWLGVPVELFDLASNPTPERIFPALIRTLGWDWPTVLGKVKTKTGIDATALISIFHACAGLVSHDIGVAIDHMRREWLKDEPDFPAKLAKAMVEAREAIVRQVSTVVVQKMAIEFGKRLAGGGVGTFVKLGLDYAAAGAEHAGSLCDLLRGALEGFQALLADGPDGPRKDAVKRRLLESFDRALPLLFTGLSTGAGLGNPGRVVGEAVMAVQGRAGKPLDVLLEFLGKHFGQLADATFTRFGLMANDRLLPGVTRPLIAPVSATIGEHNARLWVSSAGTDRKPMILINPIIDMGANLRGQNVSPPPGRRWCRPVTAAWKRRSSGNSTS